jgi:hypothetical protein
MLARSIVRFHSTVVPVLAKTMGLGQQRRKKAAKADKGAMKGRREKAAA